MEARMQGPAARRLLRWSRMEFSWPMMLSGIGAVVLVCAAIVVSVKFLEGQSERGRQAIDLQQRIAEPISRDPALANAAILPVARLRRFGRSEVELTGQVPSAVARSTVVTIAERELARLRPGASLVDHLEVVAASGDAARRSA
ncbi:MAG TPA: hypothetical protein VGU22_15650 [Methylomirabilota bacterium]|jgi:hypothetical protein|nr:hypothetical protein [Methylomirabilota bacterium]